MGRRSRLTEGSCSYCRRRRLRCDLGQPRCARCREADEECNYGSKNQLKWVGGMALRGRLATSPNIAATTHDVSILSSPPQRSPIFRDSDLIAYFGKVVLPRFQIDDRLVHLDFDAVTEDQTLQQAILAVAKAHYILNSKTVNSEIISNRRSARQVAIKSFRGLLDIGSTHESISPQLFTINVLLCILDGVIEPAHENNASICHLRGGFAILTRWKNTHTKMMIHGGMHSHLMSLFATMDLVHAMLKGEKPFLEPVTWLMFANTPTWFGSLPAGDFFLTILKTYSEMACLGNVVRDSALMSDGLQLVDRCLPDIEAIFAPCNGESSDSEIQQSKAYWNTFCSVWQVSGQIYIRRALCLKNIDDDVVQFEVRRGVEILVDNTLPGMMNHCLLFPLLIIGSHCIHSQDRRVVLEALSPASSFLSFGSLSLMESFLQHHWRTFNVKTDWWECFKAISDAAFLF